MTALHTEEYRLFVEAIIAARTAANISQRELAKRLGVDHSIVAKYETRVRRLDYIEFLDVMDALGADSVEFTASFRATLAQLRQR